MKMKTTLALAMAFAAQLRGVLTVEQMASVISKNASEDYDHACATHDYVDSNVLMANAFEATLGRSPLTSQVKEGGDESPVMLDADVDLWNASWNLAKAGKFDPDVIQALADEKVLKAATDAALDAAAAEIQGYLGITTGDFAGIFFTGDNFDRFKNELAKYLLAERENVEAAEE